MAFPVSEHKCPKCPAMVKVVQAGPPPVSGRRRISCLRCGHVWHVEVSGNPLLPEVVAIHPSIVAVADTGDEKVHHPYTAYNQGHEAFEAGYPAEANPYTGKDKWLADWWETGWAMKRMRSYRTFNGFRVCIRGFVAPVFYSPRGKT